MDVFISWSGDRSKQIAVILTDWLPQVIQAVEPWMSKDIEKGARWSPEISDKLANSKIGIICLTPENLHSDWILFEAGALSKIKENKVCTFLKDLNPADIEQPLAQFQHTFFSKDDVKTLLSTINSELDHPLQDRTLNNVFEKNWPDLEERINSLPKETKSKIKKTERADREILEEILEINRQLISEIRNQEEIRREERFALEREFQHRMSIKRQKSDELETENRKAILMKGLVEEYNILTKNKKIPADKAREIILDKMLASSFSFSPADIRMVVERFK